MTAQKMFYSVPKICRDCGGENKVEEFKTIRPGDSVARVKCQSCGRIKNVQGYAGEDKR